MDDSGSESQYYAVYVVPHWDRLEVDDEEDDDDEEDVDDWGHRGYFLVGPFGVYEARADADRFAKDVGSHVAWRDVLSPRFDAIKNIATSSYTMVYIDGLCILHIRACSRSPFCGRKHPRTLPAVRPDVIGWAPTRFPNLKFYTMVYIDGLAYTSL